MLINPWIRSILRWRIESVRSHRARRSFAGYPKLSSSRRSTDTIEHLESRWLLAGAPQAHLLRDINVETPPSYPTEIVESGGRIFFTADDTIRGAGGASTGFQGNELYVIEGTNAPRLVKDIRPGYYGSAPFDLIDVGGVLFFTADDGVHGRELWKSDGTAGGTQMVADIYSGMSFGETPNSSGIRNMEVAQTEEGFKLFFAATTELGEELWMADTSGASLVRDIYQGDEEPGQPNSSSPSDLTFVPAHLRQDDIEVPPELVPATLYFSATDGVTGRELWKTVLEGGGTQTSLVMNIFEDLPGEAPNSSNPSQLIRFQNKVYFSARDGSYSDIEDAEGNVIEANHLDSHGTELWRSDGTVLGTELVKDIDQFVDTSGPGDDVPQSSAPGSFAVHNGRLYFAASDFTFIPGTADISTGRELWVTDGVVTGLVRDIRAGFSPNSSSPTGISPNSSNPTQLVSTDGFLYFKATGSTSQGQELWRTDGTASGTQLVREIRPGTGTPFLFARGMTKLGSSVIFAADEGVLGPEVWISDGTFDGTHVLRETQFGRNSASVQDTFATIGDRVYFESGAELWRTDGAETGTVMLDVPTIATVGSDPDEFAFANGFVLFAANDGVHGRELWKSDGSNGGTTLVRDISPGASIIFPGSSLSTPDSSNPRHLTSVGDRVFFVADQSSELWVSDGTAAGTVPVRDFDPSGVAELYDLVSFGDRLYFFAKTPEFGTELWVSDGTTDGTHVVKDILEDPGLLAFPGDLIVAGDKLFFRHDDGGGFELWVSDGSDEGTVKIDLAPDGGSFPGQMVTSGTLLFFVADDGTHGQELWVSNGTFEGTSMVRDIHVVEDEIDFSGARIKPIGSLAGEFYFWAEDQVIGQALWKSDGTYDGTVIVKDIRTDGDEYFGDEGDGVSAATVGGKLYFAADDGIHGPEIWKTDGTPGGTQLFKDIFPGENGSSPRELLAVGDTLFFSAELSSETPDEEGFYESFGQQLWFSDGTPDGTQVHTRINTPSGESPNPQGLATFGGDVYFVADDGIHGNEVWTTSNRLKADDALFEILARDIAYRDTFNNRPVDSPADLLKVGDTISLNVLGYVSPFVFTVDLVIHDSTSFDAYGLVGENFAPILAVRGSQEILDFFSDAFTDGIGVNQFAAVRDEVFAWLNANTTSEQRVSITGHSLGGALTQLIAANYTATGGKLDQIVTFNSPGISKTSADLFRPGDAHRVMHYVTNGDPVSLAGDKFIAGDWTRSNFSDLFLPNNHSLPVVADFVSIDDPETLAFEIRVRPDDITPETNLSLDWLNDPYYYHTDPDYFLWLTGAAIATNTIEPLQQFRDVPPALLFRASTEDLRQRIGEVLAPLQTTIDTIINTLTLAEVRAGVPDVSLNLLNLLTVSATDMSVTYFGDSSELRLQGRVELPQLYNTTADFTGDNYILMSPDGFKLRGVLSAEEIVLVPNAWELKEVHIGLDQISNPVKITAGGTLQIPTGIEVIANLNFLGTAFNSITLGVAGLNKPLGASGLFLQSISGTVDHVSELDTEPISFGGDVIATGGPEIDISLPSWAGGNFTGSLLSINVNGEIDSDHLEAHGALSLIQGLATADANVNLNWTEGFFTANGDFNMINGLIHADTAFRADSSLNISSGGVATFTIPEPIPIVGGREGLSGSFVLNFTNDDDYSNDFAAAWTSFNLPLIGLRRLGFRVYFDGSFGLIGGQAISQIPAPPTAGFFASKSLFPSAASAPETSVADSDFSIAPDTPWTLFTAQWDNAAPDTRLVLRTPSGQILTEDEIAGRTDMAIVADFNSPTRRVVVVRNPAAGIWNVSVNDSSGLSHLIYSAFADGDAPTVEIISLTGGQEQSPVTITFNAADSGSDAIVSLFYDNDNEGTDGVLIASGIVESDGVQTFVWDPGHIPAGKYFIYAQIDDGENPPVIEYSSTSIDTAASASFTIESITSVSPDPRILPVGSIDITFSSPIDPTTLTNADMSLTLDGGENLLSSPTTLTHVSGNTYRIGGLATFTGVNGTYVMTVNAVEVQDADGRFGSGSVSTNWVMQTLVPKVARFAPILPNPRETPIDFIDVTFSRPIVAETLTTADLTLKLNHGPNLLNGSETITPMDSPTGAGMTYRIGGLLPITSAAGTYTLTVNANGVLDLTNGASGSGNGRVSWTLRRVAPRVTSIPPVTPIRQNTALDTLRVTFSEPIDPATFTLDDFTLQRNGVVIPLQGSESLTFIAGQTWEIGGLSGLTSVDGWYRMTVNAAGVLDVAGVPGLGTRTVVWQEDFTAPNVRSVAGISPSPRNSPLDGPAFAFSEPIQAATLDIDDLTLTLNGGPNLLTEAQTINFVSGNTFQINGLTALTGEDGRYLLTVNGTGVVDLAGNTGVGSKSLNWLMDTLAPSSNIAAYSGNTSQVIVLSITGTDTFSENGATPSGIRNYDIYVATDNGPFLFWKTVNASRTTPTTTVRFISESDHSYAFHSMARDAVGNLESNPLVTTDASLVTEDLVFPETEVTFVDTSSSTFIISLQGADGDPNGILISFDLYVSIDGTPGRRVAVVPAGEADPAGVYYAEVLYRAVNDNHSHNYRFYSRGNDGSGKVEATPLSPADVIVSAAFPPGHINEFTLQKGASQHSMVRYLDLVFSRPDDVASIVNSIDDNQTGNDSVSLRMYTLAGTGFGPLNRPTTVSLRSKLTAVGNTIAFDFGTAGLADGYYELAIDLDSDGVFDQHRHFHRLQGDFDGNGIINSNDISLLSAALGQTGDDLIFDLNVNNVVDNIDLQRLVTLLDRQLGEGLLIDD